MWASSHGARTSWTARIITAIDAPRTLLLLLSLLTARSASAQGVREHTRPTLPGGTTVSDAQAADLTLTVSPVALRLVQSWIRIAGTIDSTGRTLVGEVFGPDAMLVRAGQRVRAFPPSSKSSMYQARITRVVPAAGGVRVEASLTSSGRQNTTFYVREIVAERGPFLSVPNEAIIEEGDRHMGYAQQGPGRYVPQEIHTGIQGELYTQVIDGVVEGTQVVTFGSFFIDAEHKLKGTEQGPQTQ